MNGKDRVRLAMNLETPDRVPVMCQLSIGHYFLHSGVDPLEFWHSSEGMAQGYIDICRRYGFDGVLVNLPGRAPGWREHLDRIEDVSDGRRLHWKNGCHTNFPADDNPHYHQPDGTQYFPTFDEIDPERLFYVEPWDTTGVKYPWLWGFEEIEREFDHFFPPYHHDTLKIVLDELGDEVSVHSEIFSPFSQFLELLNYEAALMALIEDDEKAHAVLGRLAEGAIALGLEQAALGVEAVLLSSAFAGAGFVSPGSYEEFVLPHEKKVIDGIKARYPDLPVYTHTCGAIGDRLDLMLATGTNGIDTLDPPPLGTVELADAVEQIKGKAFIKGNLDAVHSLLPGDLGAMREAVDNRLEIAAPGGGYILSTACSVAPRTAPATLEALVRYVSDKGRY